MRIKYDAEYFSKDSDGNKYADEILENEKYQYGVDKLVKAIKKKKTWCVIGCIFSFVVYWVFCFIIIRLGMTSLEREAAKYELVEHFLAGFNNYDWGMSFWTLASVCVIGGVYYHLWIGYINDSIKGYRRDRDGWIDTFFEWVDVRYVKEIERRENAEIREEIRQRESIAESNRSSVSESSEGNENKYNMSDEEAEEYEEMMDLLNEGMMADEIKAMENEKD